MSYGLASATERHQRSPETFRIPSVETTSSVQLGNYVKLIFTQGDENPGERMWVKVTSREGDSWQGILANHPYTLPELKFNALIEFDTDNIIAVMSEEELLAITQDEQPPASYMDRDGVLADGLQQAG
jgi:uncharacterized protein YegJ (DUF2314 family)